MVEGKGEDETDHEKWGPPWAVATPVVFYISEAVTIERDGMPRPWAFQNSFRGALSCRQSESQDEAK